MNEAVANEFLALPASAKALFLARASHQLTVIMRGALAGNEEEPSLEKLSAMNEVLHSMTGKLRDLLLGTTDQYPDGVFLRILSDKASSKCERELDDAMEFAASRISAGSRNRGN
jgi:hypothetical protein